jgi:malate/lactate dehydrogenase
MKIGVIGAGAVGSACLLSIVMHGAAREIVVVNRDRKRATAVATDLQYGASLSPVIDIRDGDYSDLRMRRLSWIIIVLAGVFIWHRRQQFFDRDPNVENDIPVVRNNREEEILFVWSGLMLVLLSILCQVWSA